MKRLVFVRPLFFNKGVQYLVEAASVIVSRHPVEIVTVRDGPVRGAIERMAEGVRIRHAFRLLGCTPRISKIPRESDVFVRPSLTEGLPLVVLEAMASGLPVVASRMAGTPEREIDGVTGILCTPSDPQSLATAILKLVEVPETGLGLGGTQRSSWNPHPDRQRIAAMTPQGHAAARCAA